MQKIAYLFLEIGCGGSFEFAQNTEGEVLLILELSYSNSKLFLFPLTTMQCLFINTTKAGIIHIFSKLSRL